MALMKTLWKKTLEIISYLLIFGLIYKFFINKQSSSTLEIKNELSDIDNEVAEDLEESEEVFQSEVEELEDEEKRIKDLDNSKLASEFDSEF